MDFKDIFPSSSTLWPGVGAGTSRNLPEPAAHLSLITKSSNLPLYLECLGVLPADTDSQPDSVLELVNSPCVTGKVGNLFIGKANIYPAIASSDNIGYIADGQLDMLQSFFHHPNSQSSVPRPV